MSAGLDARPIGVFDSGLGGLTVLRALHERLPGEDLIYFGDTARVPYGTKGERTVQAFARQDAGFLLTKDVKLIVVACNTASAFSMEHLAEVSSVPVIGVIEPGVEAALRLGRGGRVGVVGTSGTIRSGRYQEGLNRGLDGAGGFPPDCIMAVECPLFVPLVEEGLLEHALTRLAIEEYLNELRVTGIETLILGCTHYPLLKPEIAAFMGPDTVLVDSAEALATAAEMILQKKGLLRHDPAEDPTRGKLSYYLSDIPWKFAEVGARFLGRPITGVRTVSLAEMEAAGQALG